MKIVLNFARELQVAHRTVNFNLLFDVCVCLIHFTQFTGKIRDKLFDFAKYYGNVIGDTDQQQIKFGLSKPPGQL